jgi:hypothetical protein
MRKTAGDPLEIGENAITPLIPQPRQRFAEKNVVIH